MSYSTKTLPPGRYIQIYRGAVRGNTHQEKIASITLALNQLKGVGVKGILWHGFIGDLGPDAFRELNALCSARGLLSLAAYGLGSTNPDAAGRFIGAVAALPECTAVVLDMEGAWDSGAGAKATVLGTNIRQAAPDALICDQPWPVPGVHSGFPWEETAAFVDLRAAQWYYSDFKSSYGKDRYERCTTWFTSAWATLDQKLATKNLVRPEIKTVQGYGWDDVFSDLVIMLLNNPTLFIWCEPYPSDAMVKAIKVENELAKHGFSGPSAVEDFQKSTSGRLTADNICGPATLQELGLN